MSQHKSASMFRLSLTFDLYYAFNCSVLVFHVVACWVLVPFLFHPTPYPFLQNPLDRSVLEKSVATTETTPSKTRALQESSRFPRTALITRAPNREAKDLTTVEKISTGTAEKEERRKEQFSASTDRSFAAPSPTDNHYFQLNRCFLYVTVASTIVTSFEVARCFVARVRHRQKIKNDLDGWPQGHGGLALLLGAFLPEVLTLIGLLVDDLPVSAVLGLTSSQSSGDCDRDVSGSGAAPFPVALISTVISSSWKLCVVVVKVVRRHRHGNLSRVGAAFLFLVRSVCFLLAALSLVVNSANFFVLFGSSDVIPTNPVLAAFLRSTRGGKYRYLDDSWISLVMHRIQHPPTQQNFSDVSSLDVITSPLVRWRELLIRSPEENRTVVPVPCAVLGNWYLPFVQEPNSSCTGCTLFFSFRFLGGREVGYSAWYCAVRHCGTRAGTRISRSFGMEQFVWQDSWNNLTAEFSTGWKDRFGTDGTFPPSSGVNSTSDPGTSWVQALVFSLVSSIPVSSECQYFLTHFDNSEPAFC